MKPNSFDNKVTQGDYEAKIKGGVITVTVESSDQGYWVSASRNDQHIGTLSIGESRGDMTTFSAMSVNVDEVERRKGVASAMYDTAYAAGIYPIVPDITKQSAEGRSLWASQKLYEWKPRQVVTLLREWIGKGNSGDVYRIDNEVEKNATNDEAKVYEALKGINGIAKGYELNGKIRLPFYVQVISVDTIARDSRKDFAEPIRPNIERINNAISALSRTQYEYNDPLQFGVNADGTMDLLDFSIASNNYPKEALHNNNSALSRFYREFGLRSIGDAVAAVNEVLRGQHSRIDSPFLYDFFGNEYDGVDYRKLEDALSGQHAKYAYYVTHSKPVDLPGVAQTEMLDGVRIVLSMRPLTRDEASEWETVNVYSETDNTPFIRNNIASAVDLALADNDDEADNPGQRF